MSWAVGFLKAVPKYKVESEIDSLAFSGNAETDGPAFDQFKIAKEATKAICKGIPGPQIMVSLSGHANGIGWQKKEGWSNDMISVNVYQIIDV
jgi:hypothetical protein